MLIVNTIAPAITLRAQEITPDAPPPVETTPEVTPAETPTSPPPPPTTETPVTLPPTAGSLFLADFNTGDVSAFLTTGDWAVTDSTATFTTISPNASAIVNGMLWEDFILVTSVKIGAGGEALIGLRVGAESYVIRLSESGNATLWHGLTQLGGIIAPLPETTPDPSAPPTQYEVAISAVDGTITVAVNNVTQISIIDPAPLLAGYIVFGSSEQSTGVVGYDNMLIQAQVPVNEEPPVTPVEPVETPIIIPPLDPTPETTPIVEGTEVVIEVTEPVIETTPIVEATEVVVESTEIVPVIETTPDVELTPELTPDVELTPELTPDVELTPELTPEAELTPELTETPVPLTLYEAEIAKLDGVIWGLVQAYYGGDIEGARAFAEANYINWREDERLQIWIYPYASDNIPQLAASLLEMNGEVLYLSDWYVDAVVSLDTLTEIARMGIVFAITLPVPAVPTSADDVQINGIGTPQLMADTGTGTVIPHTLDQLGISSWHDADILGANVNIALIDMGFDGTLATTETACLGNTTAYPTNGTGDHGLNVVEILCDIAPLSKVWIYTASDASSLAVAITTARQGVTDNIPPADVILITLNPNSTNTALENAVKDAYDNNIPVIAAAGNGGDNNSLTFSVTAGDTSTLRLNARAGDIITITPTLLGNATSLTQVDGDYNSTNAGTIPHAYTIGAECGDGCLLDLTITRTNADNYTVTSSWANTIIEPDSSVTVLNDGDELIDYTTNYHVLAVGSVCGTQTGRFPLAPYSPQGALTQQNTPRVKPDLVAPANVNTSLLSGATVNPDFTCSGGFSGSSASAAHVAGMVALIISNPAMTDIYEVTSGISRPWQLFSYLKSRALDVNNDGFDRNYGAGVATLGNPQFELRNEITPENAPNTLNAQAYTLYVSSDQLSKHNLTSQATVPAYPAPDPLFATAPDGSFSNPFIHITDALEAATLYRQNDLTTPITIVLLPGEYTTPFTIGISNVSVVSFDAVDTQAFPPSVIWVSDNVVGGAVVMNGQTDITLNGLVFQGASPDYAFSGAMGVNAITSLSATNINNLTLTDMGFYNFDSPVNITGGTGVTITNSAFSRFDTEGTPFKASALLLDSVGGVVELHGNFFDYNITNLTSSVSSARALDAVVYLRNTEATFIHNHFLGNVAYTLLTVDMWETYPDYGNSIAGTKISPEKPVLLYNNVFNSNTVTGPVIHLMQGNRFSFINNTVANNILQTAYADTDPITSNPIPTNWFTIIGLGDNTLGATNTNVLAENGDHQWNIFNNVFFANRSETNSIANLALISERGGINANFTCLAINDLTADSGVKYNWFTSGENWINGGDCATAIALTTNGNIITNVNNTELDSDANVLTVGTQELPGEVLAFEQIYFRNDETYAYQLSAEAALLGVVDPFSTEPSPLDAIILPIITDNIPSTNDANSFENPLAVDILGNPRFRKQDNNNTSAYSHADMGAYEFNNQLALEFYSPNPFPTGMSVFSNGDFTYSFNEDDTLTIDFNNFVRYGFQPYEFVFVPSETITESVCIIEGIATCAGRNLTFNKATYILTYKPPTDFHNRDLTDPDAQLSIQYRVNTPGASIPSTTTYATITIVVNPVNDGGVTNTGTLEVFIEPDPATETLIDLNPRYSISPFSLPDATGTNNRDYPFTYSEFVLNPQAVGYDSRLAAGVNFLDDVRDGVLYYNPPSTSINGVFEFTYTAIDHDNQRFAVPRTVRVHVRSILKPGKYDDTVLGIAYRGNWDSSFAPGFYQDTQHTLSGTTNPNQYATFSFEGDAFFIKGNGNGLTLNNLLIKPTNNADFMAHSALNNVQCTLEIGGIYCQGFNASYNNQVRTVRITPADTQSVVLDFVEIYNTPLYRTLNVGVYEDKDADTNPNNDLASAFRDITSTVDTRSANGSWAMFNNATTSQLAFLVTTNVKRMYVYRPMDTLRDNLTVTLSGNACTTTSITLRGDAPETMWEIPQAITLNGCTFVRIVRTPMAGKTAMAGIDRIELVDEVLQPLGAVTIPASELFKYATGRTGLSGNYFSLYESNLEFDIPSNISVMIIYNDRHTIRPSLVVSCIAHSMGSGTIMNNTPSQTISPVTIEGPWKTVPCSRIRISAPMGTNGQPALLDKIVIYTKNTGTLGLGYYDDANLRSYFSESYITSHANALGATMTGFNSSSAQSNLTFTVASDVKRMILYRYMNANANSLRVQLSNGCNANLPASLTDFIVDSYTIDERFGQKRAVDLNGCRTVTISRVDVPNRTQNSLIDAIELLGDKPSLGAGNYSATQMSEFVYGNSVLVNNASALDGVFHRLIDGTIEFNITPDIRNMILYRLNNTIRDAIRVECLDIAGLVIGSQDIANTSATDVWSSPTLVSIPSGCVTVRVSRANKINPPQNSTSNPALERITLLANSPATLGIGMYDNLQILDKFTAPNLQYTANAYNGTWTPINSTNTLTFKVASSVKRVIIYRNMSTTADDLQVQVSDSIGDTCYWATISSITIDDRWQHPSAIDILEGCNRVTITRPIIAGRTPPMGLMPFNS